MNGADKFHQVPSRKELRWTKAEQARWTGTKVCVFFDFRLLMNAQNKKGMDKRQEIKPFVSRATTWMFQEVSKRLVSGL